MTRLLTPTWGAARPMPGAAWTVSTMSRARRTISSVDGVHGLRPPGQDRVADDEDFAHGHAAYFTRKRMAEATKGARTDEVRAP